MGVMPEIGRAVEEMDWRLVDLQFSSPINCQASLHSALLSRCFGGSKNVHVAVSASLPQY